MAAKKKAKKKPRCLGCASMPEYQRRAGMLMSVHGALLDAGFPMGDIGKCECDRVLELTAQRDAARARVAELEKLRDEAAETILEQVAQLKQALAYERDEYEQYRAEHPHESTYVPANRYSREFPR